MPEKSSKGDLEDKHSAGKNLIEILLARMQKDYWTGLDYQRFALDYIRDSDVLEDYTNDDRTGFIDLAITNGINLNENEEFLIEFWQDCITGASEYIQTEDQAVRRGALLIDGRTSARIGAIEDA